MLVVIPCVLSQGMQPRRNTASGVALDSESESWADAKWALQLWGAIQHIIC